MSSPRFICAACQREIDAAARLCPFCGADPRPAEKLDTQPRAQQETKPPQLTPTQKARMQQRQGAVIAFAVAALALALVALHQFATRNETATSKSNAAPLAEVTDISPQPDSQPPPPMPDLQYRYDGDPQAIHTGVVEPGAVTPPAVNAAQQVAAKPATSQPHPPLPPLTAPPHR
jgi:hypothetical protein